MGGARLAPSFFLSESGRGGEKNLQGGGKRGAHKHTGEHIGEHMSTYGSKGSERKARSSLGSSLVSFSTVKAKAKPSLMCHVSYENKLSQLISPGLRMFFSG